MKKEENQKSLARDTKIVHDQRSRSHSPKAYLGCDTCKLKNSELKKIKSVSKFNLSNNIEKNRPNKFYKTLQEKEKEELYDKKVKIKLTDLCDEDKKRIVELIEELSKFANKNEELKETIDRMRKATKDQQDYIMKQANIHLEEKNFFVNEINDYKSKFETLESEMKNKLIQWEKHEKFMNTEIAYFARALKDSLKEKNELNEQMNHLKNSLRQALESFQRLKDEIAVLQHQEKNIKESKSVCCQTTLKNLAFREKFRTLDYEADEEYFPIYNNNNINAKSSLDIINDKLEHVCQLLKRKSESLEKSYSKKLDIDLSILLRNEKLASEEVNLVNISKVQQSLDVSLFPIPSISSPDDEFLKEENERTHSETGYKFLKPFGEHNKTTVEFEQDDEKKIKKLSNAIIMKTLDMPSLLETRGYVQDLSPIESNALQKTLCMPSENENEERLLEELFYSDGTSKYELTSVLKVADLYE